MTTGVFKKAGRLLGLAPGTTAGLKSTVRARPVMSHHAVSVVAGNRACAAAKALGNKRFLSREAPMLPLRNCDCANCECRYEHYQDRRRGPRRAREMGVALDGYDGAEKRSNGPKRRRRKGDR